jgi:hypothetical protein
MQIKLKLWDWIGFETVEREAEQDGPTFRILMVTSGQWRKVN